MRKKTPLREWFKDMPFVALFVFGLAALSALDAAHRGLIKLRLMKNLAPDCPTTDEPWTFGEIGDRDRANTITRAVLADPSTSAWLYDAIIRLKRRDPVDACNDTEKLHSLTKVWVEEAAKVAGAHDKGKKL